jgi:hypothetical protein
MENATQALHRITSYVLGRDLTPFDDPLALREGPFDDLDRRPLDYKRYAPPPPRVPLPRDLPPTTAPGLAVLAGTAQVAAAEPDLAQLSRLLHLSAGVVRTGLTRGRLILFRAAASGGGRFPLELYLAVPEGHPLPAGVHWYDPEEHALVQVGPAPRGPVPRGPAVVPTVVVTAVPWRAGWPGHTRERGYRHMCWDAGTMLAQLLAVADSAGLRPQLYTRFPDATVGALVGADGVHEFPVAVVALGDGTPALDPTGPAAAGEVDAAPIEFPLITRAQRAGDHDSLGQPWPVGLPVDVAIEETTSIEALVFARGSQRLMDGTRGLPRRVLDTSMPIALRGVDLPVYVAVHDIDGVEPGLYRWPDLSTPVRPGSLREELHKVCLNQDLAHDAAFVVISAVDVGTLDGRRYREAQLTAGLVSGRLHLLAYSLGASASSMTFIDSEIPALLGDDKLSAMLFTCVGVPAYKSATAGPPGTPTQVQVREPRIR